MSDVVYALNTTASNVVIRSGYIEIAQGKYAALSKSESEIFEVQYAVRNGWIKLSALEPREGFIPEVEIVKITNPLQGMTAEELKEDLAKQVEVPATTVTSLGNSEETIGEPTVTRLGQDSTVEVDSATVAAEASEAAEAAAPRRGVRKAKA